MSPFSYLAFRGTELPIAIVGIVFVFVYLLVRINVRERMQKRRIELVETAVRSGAIDAATKRELVAAVTGERRPRRTAHPLFLVGWVGLFVGAAMIVISAQMGHMEHMLAPGILVTAISFAVLSLPIAARELQARSQGHDARGEEAR